MSTHVRRGVYGIGKDHVRRRRVEIGHVRVLLLQRGSGYFFPRFGIGRIEQLFLLGRRYGVDDAVEAVEQRVGRERPRVRAHLPAGQDVGSGGGVASLCVQ